MSKDLKTKMTVVKDLHTDLPCALCGELLVHNAVVPAEIAKLVYRATMLFDRVWLPVKHRQVGLCPDPPPETAAFWHDDVRRERWKREHRKAMEASRGR